MSNFMKKRPSHDQKGEGMKKLEACVDTFAELMKQKLRQKADEGFSGWNERLNFDGIMDSFIQHSLWQYRRPHKANEEVDIANLIMMIWHLNGRKPNTSNEDD